MRANTPYRKIYQDGIVINPIKGEYESRMYLYTDQKGNRVHLPNRRERRSKPSSLNNRKINKARNNRQIINMANGKSKIIVHLPK